MNDGKGLFLRLYHKALTCLWNPWFVLFPFLERIPFPYRLEAKEAAITLRGLIIDMLHEMRAKIDAGEHTTDDNKSDVLSLMIKSTRSEDTGKSILTDAELVNNSLIFFAAGHDTSSNTMSFIFYFLATHPEVQEKIREELCEVLCINRETLGLQEEVTPSQAQVRQFVYLTAVIHESMRLAPTTPEVPRIMGRDWDIGNGVVIPKGTKVLLQYYASMNDPKQWKDPQEFNPERFIKRSLVDGIATSEIDKERIKKLTVFGGGPRLCIGATFALVMQKVMLAVMLQKFRLSLPADSIHKNGLITNKVGLCAPADLDVICTPLQ
ncbi:hypothetical protein DSO57_1025386 [Entomophthora muscae]|uniref:Uncharacterized protein n=1 Tax=Entomophthora muscae TaxID=34485 RepID=A0ACC2S4B5_9FUNG|nr:hypothetical protein DSO57_1025386 [Entomophthora muscae]